MLIIGNKEGNRTRHNINYKNIENYNNYTCNYGNDDNSYDEQKNDDGTVNNW